jgi:hypothetical protein
MSPARAALSQRPEGRAPSRGRSSLSYREDESNRGTGCPSARVVCRLSSLAGIDLASRLITAPRGAKETALSPCRRNRQRTQGRLRRAAHVALKRCIWRERRRGSADCPTCTPLSASAARPPTSRKAGRQDGATLICFICFANKRANAAGWQRWRKIPMIVHFGFACPNTGRNWRKMPIGKQARPCTCAIQPNVRFKQRTLIAWICNVDV